MIHGGEPGTSLWDNGLTVAAHQLGKCYRDGLGVIPDDEKAEAWFCSSAEAGNDFSQYALGKLLQSERRIEEAAEWYKRASAQRNQYTNYRLGKLYLQGEEVPKDVSKAIGYLTVSAEIGNQYAQFFLDHFQQIDRPSVFLAATKLLHRLAQTFRQDAVPPKVPTGLGPVDRKLRAQIREKKIAMGHKPDDHEQQQGWTMTMG